jgi:hypothetical protein
MSNQDEHAIETYKSLVTLSLEGLKAILLINGGAVVAMLTFLGHAQHGEKLAAHMWWPLGFFIGGVICCAFAFIGSYGTQLALYNETVSPALYSGPSHKLVLALTVGLAILSVLCFAGGAFSSIDVLVRFTNPL